MPTATSWRVWVMTTGPSTIPEVTTERYAPSRPGFQSLAKALCEKAACSSDIEATAPGSCTDAAAVTSRAPKLWPARCSRARPTTLSASTGPTERAPIVPALFFIS